MSDSERVKLFQMSHSLLHVELDRIEREFGIDLERGLEKPATEEDLYYPQFTQAIRAEASEMSSHYAIFYCLENTIRELVSAQLLATVGSEWWEKVVPGPVKENVQKNLQREREAGVTIRSSDPIDYTTFGELSDIIQANWDAFGDSLRDRKAAVRVLAGLNLLRAPIAHCSALAPDEVLRLRLALRDWFRLMS